MILIIGIGDVGSNIAADLAETHDITLIDRDPDKINTLTSELDVSGVVGDGRSVSVLREAGLDQADIIVASTDSDAANIMVCNAAKRSGNPHTIARVKDTRLFQTWKSLDGNLGVDTMLCIDILAAEAVTQTIALPGAQAVDTFADGRVEVAEFHIEESTPVTDLTVAEADKYPSTTFAALLRDDEILIPDGDTVIRSGDDVVVIGSLRGVSRFAEAISSHPTLNSDDSILIAGGDVLGYQIARRFETRGWTPHIIEHDLDQATWLTTHLEGSSVAETDVRGIGAFNPDLLRNAELVVGAIDDDTNYLLAQLAREYDVSRTAAIVETPDLIELFEETGLDVVVHPQDIIAGEILQVVYELGSEDVGVLEHDNAEVLEVVIDEESVLTGVALRDAADQLPGSFVIGAILRDGELQIPRGNKIIQTNDRIIAFVDAEAASEISELI